MTDEVKAEEYILSLELEKGNKILQLKEVIQAMYQVYLAGLKAGREETEKQWHDCFLSCSSPYCAGHFRDVKCEGELGNMSKREGE